MCGENLKTSKKSKRGVVWSMDTRKLEWKHSSEKSP